jgi:hypothetical protein
MLVAEVAVARLAAQVAAAMVLTIHRALLRLWQELLTQEAGVAVAAIQARLARLEALALLSCPTPCQKAQLLNSCLLRHGKHQRASLPLTIWW